VPLCEEALVAAGGSAEASAAAAKRALAAGAAAAGAGAGKKAEKPKKEAAPKAEKPKAEKKEKAPKEEDADAPPPMDLPKEVKKDPFGGLAKTSLNLDEWKRHYSNTKPHIGAMPWFWEHLDREGWSVWRQDYNYNNENTRDFMTSNLVGALTRRGSTERLPRPHPLTAQQSQPTAASARCTHCWGSGFCLGLWCSLACSHSPLPPLGVCLLPLAPLQAASSSAATRCAATRSARCTC